MKIQRQHLPVILMILAIVGAIAADHFYFSKFIRAFNDLEEAKINTANKLATAKIVQENLNHVEELVQKNMIIPGQIDSLTPQERFFEFFTACLNDLKLELNAIKPFEPVRQGRTTILAYEIELQGNFFNFGELCAKFENNRRIVSIERFDLKKNSRGDSSSDKQIKVKMTVNTYTISK